MIRLSQGSPRRHFGAAFAAAFVVLAATTATLAPRTAHAGMGFSAPAVLNTNNASDGTTSDGVPSIATDGSGNWVAVWSHVVGIAVDSDLYVSRSSDNGVTWTAPADLNTNAGSDTGSDQEPQIATDHAGNWAVMWLSTENIGGSGTDTDILVTRSTNNGLTWTAPALLNSNAVGDSAQEFHPTLVTDSGGTWIASWFVTGLFGADQDIVYSRSTNNGVSWSSLAALNTNASSDTGHDADAEFATDGSTWLAVWLTLENIGGIGTDGDIVFSRSTNGGISWSAPAALNSYAVGDSGFDGAPSAATNGAGNFVVVWTASGNVGGSGTDGDIVRAVSADNGATWGTAAILNSNATTDTQYDAAPLIATDNAGTWICAWYGPNGGPEDDIYVSRSQNNGGAWSTVEFLQTNAPGDAGYDFTPQLIHDGNFKWIAAWTSNNNISGSGTDYEVNFAVSTTVPVEVSAFSIE